MSQPEWQCIANIGCPGSGADGGFVFVDKTGVYVPELEIWETDEVSDEWTVYRFELEPLFFDMKFGVCCDYEKKYRPDHPQDEWFSDKLDDVARCVGLETAELISQLTSRDPITRAFGYDNVARFYGYFEFDQYPRTAKEAELEEWADRHNQEIKEYRRGKR